MADPTEETCSKDPLVEIAERHKEVADSVELAQAVAVEAVALLAEAVAAVVAVEAAVAVEVVAAVVVAVEAVANHYTDHDS